MIALDASALLAYLFKELAASILPKTKPLGLSLADRACLSLALARNIPVVTADQVWQQTDFGLTITVIR